LQVLSDFLTAAVRWVGQEPGIALLIGVGAYLILAVLVIWTLARYGRMARRQARLLRGADGSTLERMLLDHADGSVALRSEIRAATETGVQHGESLQRCLQRVGIVRYDAFGDVGGRQSFSIALLDAGGNGIVVTGLHARSDMRVYAKPVVSGRSALALTEEEIQAIAESRSGGPTMGEDLALTATANGRRR